MVEDIKKAPTVDAEPTEEQVKEYCRKRCLVIVNSELFNEMKARWSAVPVKPGHWVKNGDRYCECSVCHHEGNISGQDNYCWFCGAKMISNASNALDALVDEDELV